MRTSNSFLETRLRSFNNFISADKILLSKLLKLLIFNKLNTWINIKTISITEKPNKFFLFLLRYKTDGDRKIVIITKLNA